MNMNRLKAESIKHQMQVQAQLDNQPAHAQHVIHTCDYADATAAAAAEDIKAQLTAQIEKEVLKQMQSGKVSVEVDKASVKSVQKAIMDAFSPLRKWMK